MRTKLLKVGTELVTYPFAVERLDISIDDRELGRPYYRLRSPDWVNVLPVTSDGKAILIRQDRVGPMAVVLETPGGVVEEGEKDLMMAALREMEEETGYTSQRIIPLANLNPNPAIQTNRIHYFLALGCQKNPNRTHFPDKEEVLDVVEFSISELDSMVRTGQIDHSLSALCIMLSLKYLQDR